MITGENEEDVVEPVSDEETEGAENKTDDKVEQNIENKEEKGIEDTQKGVNSKKVFILFIIIIVMGLGNIASTILLSKNDKNFMVIIFNIILLGFALCLFKAK